MAPWGRILWAVYLRVEVSSIRSSFRNKAFPLTFSKDLIVAQVRPRGGTLPVILWLTLRCR